MKKNIISLPSQETLKEIFHYDGQHLRWRIRPSHNTQKGDIAGCIGGKGYRTVVVSYTKYLAHRLIWAWVYGSEPNQIDHINGIRIDNRIDNLRSVTGHENAQNRRSRLDNRSGVTGVSLNSNKWMARISYRNKNIQLGSFYLFENAVTARRQAEIKYGYHENHGRA